MSKASEKAKWNREKAKWCKKVAESRGRRKEGEGSKERSKAALSDPSGPVRHRGKKIKTVEQAKEPGTSKKRKKARTPRKTIYKGAVMDSGSELAFAMLLDEYGVVWEKNTSRKFDYTDAKGVAKRYIPDFYLPEYDEWVEIKGRYYQTRNLKLQLDAVGDNIELIYSDEIRLPECCAHKRKQAST